MFLNTAKLLVSHSMRPVACSAEKCKEQGKSSKNKRVCFYCLDPEHLIAYCKDWKKKNIAGKPKIVANIVCEPMVNVENQSFSEVSTLEYKRRKSISAIYPDSTGRSISILRDPGLEQSFIL